MRRRVNIAVANLQPGAPLILGDPQSGQLSDICLSTLLQTSKECIFVSLQGGVDQYPYCPSFLFILSTLYPLIEAFLFVHSFICFHTSVCIHFHSIHLYYFVLLVVN